MASPLHSADAMARAIANDPSLVGVPSRPAPVATPLYQSLTAQSTPAQIAQAYSQFTSGAGGDTAANQQQAISYLQNLGVAAPTINQAYEQYTQPAAPAAPDYEQMVRDAYGSIGRTGIGTEASNIDQEGFNNWVNALQSGAVNPADLTKTFQSSVADYLVANPEDQYSTYVADYLSQSKPAAVSGIVDLYREVLGRDPDPSGLGNWYQQFGEEISPEERAAFEKSAAAELQSRVQGLYTDFLGRAPEQEGLDYWTQQFGSDITDDEREQFRQSAAAELTGTFGGESPDDAKLLEGFKRVNDLGIDEAALRRTLGDETYDTYKNQLANFATTNLEGILADNQLTFDESQKVYNFARDLGYGSEDLARLTGQDKGLFDLIDTNYKTSRDQIIKGSLEAPTVESDADRVLTALALQDQFGFSDEDLSEATGYKLEDLKLSLDPVRNFQSDFSSLVGSTDTTTDQLKQFLGQATGNAAINKMYGESLGQVGAKLQELEQKWSPYKTDAFQAENLYNQLAGQKDALGGQYYRGVFGDLEKSAAALVNKGLDTLNDLGQKDKFQTVKATQDGSGRFGRLEYIERGGHLGFEFIPLNESELATLSDDGTYQKKIGTVVIDKDTGKELTGLDGNLLYQRSGGHATGKKHYLTAQFTPEGVPILTASEEKSGIYKFVSDVGPMIVSVAAMIPGPHQPFAMAANAALALEQKNYIGAVLSGLGAYGTYTGQELASLTAAQKAGTVTDAAATASQIKDLTGTLSNIKLAQTAAAGVNALATKNLPGLINASLSAYGQTGGKLPSGLTTAVQAGNLAVAIDKGDVAGAMNALGDLTQSKDFKIAGAAKTLVDAFETGDMSRIASAGLAFSKIVGSSDGKQAPTEGKRADAGVVEQLADAGLEEVSLPTGIQTASADGETPFRVEAAGAPIFADSPQAGSVRPPPGYRLMATSEEQEVQDGGRTRYVKPAGSYYDYTANAWFTPSGEFDFATDVKDYSALFGGDQANLTDADLAAIRGDGLGAGSNASDFGVDWDAIYQPSGAPRSGGSDMGEMVITAPRDAPTDLGEMVITAPREPVTDMGEMVITAPRDATTDLGEMVITAPREEFEYPEMVVTAPREPAAPAAPGAPTPPATPAVPATPTTPAQVAQVKKQLALTLNLPVSSPIVQDVFEALYGTMEYLDIGEEFEPSARKAKPAATQKQLQQTKMAQGGYLDDLLAENMSADDLLNLLR